MTGQIYLRTITSVLVLWLLWASPVKLWAQIGMQYGDTVSGSLANATSIAMYRFDGEAGDFVTIKAFTDARCQPQLSLMNAALVRVALSSPSLSETEAQINIQLLDTAPYYISLSSTNGTPCNFVLTLEGEREADRPTNTPAPAPTVPSVSLVSFDINVSSTQTTIFSQNLPTMTVHQHRLHYIDLANAHPQTFRITLNCPGNDGIMLEDMRCGDTFTFIPTSLEAGLIPVHTINLVIPAALTNTIAYSLTIVPESPLLPISPDDLIPFDINVSSHQTTVFSQTLPPLVIHQLRLHFVDLANAQPQTFRITLACPGNDDVMLGDIRCGDTFTFTPTAAQAGMIPAHTINLAVPSPLTFPGGIAYTLTVVSESAYLPIAAADNDHLINAPLSSVTTFNQTISAPLGDSADKITIRVPDLFSGSWDFTFSLLCAGTGTEFVQWSLQSGQVLACGNALTVPLVSVPGSNPIPSLDMVVALAGQQPAYVNYTLLITPAGSAPNTSTGTYSFAVGLDGESQFLQSLSSTQYYHTVNVTVPGVLSGYPRKITFTLACASTNPLDVKAAMTGVSDELACGSSFERSFSSSSEQAQFSIQLIDDSPVSYILHAAPVFAMIAPPDANPHTLNLHATQPVTLAEVMSWPEGDYEDRIVLNASQIRAAALPRTYAISLNCEGPGATALRGEAGSLTFGCGETFEYIFGASSSREPTPGRNDLQIAPSLPGSTATPRRSTGDTTTTLSLRVYLPNDALPGLVNYILRAVPVEQGSTQPELVSSNYTVNASSTTATTFSQTLTPTQQHKLQIRFPDLVNAHRQTFRLQLLCTGVGTASVIAVTDSGDTLLCGGSFDQIFESFSSNPLPGTDLTLDFVQTNALASVQYTLRIEPVSPYVPIAPDDVLSEPYQLAISTTQQTVFSQAISAPLGDSSDRIQTMIPTMIGGQTAGRDFTFWLQCAGQSTGGIHYVIELPEGNWHYGLCNVPLTVYLDESIGSPPRPFIRIEMATTSQPAYSNYTLYITPAGVEPPFTIPQTATPTTTPLPAPTVISTTPPPALIGPSNGAVFDTQPVQLSWSEIPGARYEVEIQRCTTDGTNCVTDMILVNATSHSLSVATSAQINWRVRALLSDGSFTNFTSYRSFKVFLGEPTATPVPVLALIGPSNGAVFDTQPVQLSWSEMPGARYEVEIQRCTTDGTNCVTDMILVNATSHSLSVAASAQINWRVRALLPDGSFTAFTPYRSFKIFLGEPTATPAPVLALIGPSNNATFDTQPVQLSWSEMPGARYEVEIQRCTTDGTNCVTDMILVNATSHSLSVAASAQINWRVRALLPDGSTTAFTSYRSFKVFLTLPTATPTPVLALIAPADGVTFTAQPVQLSWSALPGTASYSIEIQRCATDATNCVVENIVTSNSSLALSLTASAHINWRVRATLTDGSTTAFTSYRSFKVFLTLPTATPTPVLALIAPADGVTFTAQPVQLSWSALPGTASYSIEIQRCATDATNCVVENIVTSNSSLALSLTASAHINWRVRATLTDGSTTAFTSYRSFKVFLTLPTATPSPRATAAMVRATPTQTPSR